MMITERGRGANLADMTDEQPHIFGAKDALIDSKRSSAGNPLFHSAHPNQIINATQCNTIHSCQPIKK